MNRLSAQEPFPVQRDKRSLVCSAEKVWVLNAKSALPLFPTKEITSCPPLIAAVDLSVSSVFLIAFAAIFARPDREFAVSSEQFMTIFVLESVTLPLLTA